MIMIEFKRRLLQRSTMYGLLGIFMLWGLPYFGVSITTEDIRKLLDYIGTLAALAAIIYDEGKDNVQEPAGSPDKPME